MRSKGLQPGEELLPEDGMWYLLNSVSNLTNHFGLSQKHFLIFFYYHVAPGGEEESAKLLPNEDIVSQLATMGFNHLHCQKAAINTSNAGVEEAMNWLLSHMDDPGFTFYHIISYTYVKD